MNKTTPYDKHIHLFHSQIGGGSFKSTPNPRLTTTGISPTPPCSITNTSEQQPPPPRW
ncbi:hypothetical protein Hanom_Chr16g01485531 [Helianthus anomalus]